jgi:hypothetical protein
MMIFRHGLGGGRADMLTVADTYAAHGLVTVAIDAAKHGDRSFCTPTGPAAQCQGGATCTSALPNGAQGDASPPGTCTAGKFNYLPVSSSCLTNAACNWPNLALGFDGIPAVSANYLVTSNFFRTRDTFRQDFIDESQLVRAIAASPMDGTTVFTYMLSGPGGSVVIDPFEIYYSGQSLGSIQGIGDVATNPRISKAAFNVGGGTTVDIFTNSPAFVSTTNALLQSLGIVPGTSQYLQFLVVAKTVLDPAEPVNFADHLTENNLPNLIGDQTGMTPQTPKAIMAQAAFCDQTVPNPFNYILAENFGTVGPLPSSPTFGAGTGTFTLFWNTSTGGAPSAAGIAACSGATVPGGAVEHGFITDWNDAAMTSTAQGDIANFVISGTLPPSIRALP